jgi:hypothetical protein
MGLLAELGVRTYHESQGKPTYVVRQVVEAGKNPRAYRSRRLLPSEAAVVRGS